MRQLLFLFYSMTPLDEFKKLVPEHHDLSDGELTAMRDLIDLQVDMILDRYQKDKADGII